MGNALSASFGLDLAPLKRDFAEAKKMAAREAADVTRTMAQANQRAARSSVNWGSISSQRSEAADFFRRNGPITAANFRRAPRGKYLSPAEQAAEEAGSASGTIRGIGHGLTAIAVVHELAAAYQAADEKASKLRNTVSELTRIHGAAAFRGEGSITSNLGEVTKTLDEIRQRDMTESQGGERTPWMTLGHIVKSVRQGLTGGSDKEDESQRAKLRAQASRDIDQLAEKQRALNEAERESVSGSEWQAGFLKLQIEHREKLGVLAEAEAAAGVHNKAARDAENERYDQAVSALDHRVELRAQEINLQSQILNNQNSGLSKDQQEIANLKLKISLLNKRMAGTGTVEEKQNWSLEAKGLQNQLYRAQYAQRFDGPALYTPEKGAEAQFQSWMRSQHPSTPGAYLHHPDAYARHPDAYGAPGEKQTSSFGDHVGDLISAINNPDWVK